MTTLEQTKVDINRLRKVYGNDSCAKAILDIAASRKNNSYSTNVDRLMWVISQGGASFSRRDVITALRELEKANCGAFIIGRRGQPSRFQWAVEMIAAGRAARGDQKDVEPLAEGDARKGTDEEIEVKAGVVRHSYKLRPDFSLGLDLPEDLSTNEAARLAEFIKTLPFEPADHAG